MIPVIIVGAGIAGLAVARAFALRGATVTVLEQAEAIREAIRQNSQGSLGVHYLRSRRAGAATFVAFDLVVPEGMTVRDAHVICDRLEMAVHKAVPGTRVTIHVEPENEVAHGAGIELGR